MEHAILVALLSIAVFGSLAFLVFAGFILYVFINFIPIASPLPMQDTSSDNKNKNAVTTSIFKEVPMEQEREEMKPFGEPTNQAKITRDPSGAINYE